MKFIAIVVSIGSTKKAGKPIFRNDRFDDLLVVILLEESQENELWTENTFDDKLSCALCLVPCAMYRIVSTFRGHSSCADR